MLNSINEKLIIKFLGFGLIMRPHWIVRNQTGFGINICPSFPLTPTNDESEFVFAYAIISLHIPFKPLGSYTFGILKGFSSAYWTRIVTAPASIHKDDLPIEPLKTVWTVLHPVFIPTENPENHSRF
jgi:hypothetical protein